MAVLSAFLPMDSDIFELVHMQVSYSSTRDLRRRLALFACDIFIYSEYLVPVGHEIKNCTVFWSLTG